MTLSKENRCDEDLTTRAMAELDRLAMDTSRADYTRLEEQRGLQAPHTSGEAGLAPSGVKLVYASVVICE